MDKLGLHIRILQQAQNFLMTGVVVVGKFYERRFTAAIFNLGVDIQFK